MLRFCIFTRTCSWGHVWMLEFLWEDLSQRRSLYVIFVVKSRATSCCTILSHEATQRHGARVDIRASAFWRLEGVWLVRDVLSLWPTVSFFGWRRSETDWGFYSTPLKARCKYGTVAVGKPSGSLRWLAVERILSLSWRCWICAAFLNRHSFDLVRASGALGSSSHYPVDVKFEASWDLADLNSADERINRTILKKTFMGL